MSDHRETGEGDLSDQEPTEPMDQLRDYGVGAQILNMLGVHEMELLTNSDRSLVALDGYGVSIIGKRPIDLD